MKTVTKKRWSNPEIEALQEIMKANNNEINKIYNNEKLINEISLDMSRTKSSIISAMYDIKSGKITVSGNRPTSELPVEQVAKKRTPKQKQSPVIDGSLIDEITKTVESMSPEEKPSLDPLEEYYNSFERFSLNDIKVSYPRSASFSVNIEAKDGKEIYTITIRK
jgi:hypothetical protein